MSRIQPRLLATLMLLPYAWLIAGSGPELHGLAHTSDHSHCSTDGDGLPDPSPIESGTDADCPVCELLGQAQLPGELPGQGPSVRLVCSSAPLLRPSYQHRPSGPSHPRGPPSLES